MEKLLEDDIDEYQKLPREKGKGTTVVLEYTGYVVLGPEVLT